MLEDVGRRSLRQILNMFSELVELGHHEIGSKVPEIY